MKTYFILLLSILIPSFAKAQDQAPDEQVKLNSIAIEFYQPITTSELDHYYKNNWLNYESFGPEVDRSRKRNSIGIGVAYEGMLSGSTVVRARIGISLDKLSETNSYENLQPFFEYDSQKVNEQFNFKQIHFNLFFGLAKRFKLLKKLSADIGFEIPLITYLSPESKFSSFSELVIVQDPLQTKYINEIKRNINYGTALSYGIGPIIKFDYPLYHNLYLSVESKFYFLRSNFNSPVTIYQLTRNYSIPSVGNEGFFESNLETEVKLSQWSWSNTSFVFRVAYQF